MRKWHKYYLDPSVKGIVRLDIDKTLDDHARSMDGYEIDDNYGSKERLFKKYFHEFQDGRLEHYDNYLSQHVRPQDDILSIASGRSVNELVLLEKGFNITCSDLSHFAIYDETKRLFPKFNFTILDILGAPAPRRYDGIMCLSLIYLYDAAGLDMFLENVAGSLKYGGYLILDSAGPADNLFSTLFLDVYLRLEAAALRLLSDIKTGKRPGLVIKLHGYRKTDNEIIELARKHGLLLEEKASYPFPADLKRSVFYSRLLEYIPSIENIAKLFGKVNPYIRMYKFVYRKR